MQKVQQTTEISEYIIKIILINDNTEAETIGSTKDFFHFDFLENRSPKSSD